MKEANMKMLIILFLFLSISGCANQPVKQTLLQSTVELDRAYIPTLIFVNLQKQRESEISFERFKKRWNKFYDKYYDLEMKYGQDIVDKFWKEDFDLAAALVVFAEGLIKEEKLSDAYDQLKKIRIIFKSLRARNGQNYFLDNMTGFDNAMEEVLSTLRGKDRLTHKDLDTLRDLFKIAQKSWGKLLQSEENDLAIFGFDAVKIGAVRERIKNEEQGLAAFAASLSSSNTDKIFQAAQDLKPNFVVLYKAFGDFQPVFDQVVKERKEKESKEKKDEIGSE